MKRYRKQSSPEFAYRRVFVLGLFVLGMALLAGRAVELQIFEHDVLRGEGNVRQTRVVEISAHRGTIFDRNGEPLAVSTPVDSIWINPRRLDAWSEPVEVMSRMLGLSKHAVRDLALKNPNKSFVYVRRHLSPEEAAAIMKLKIAGVGVQREYRRYYPMGESFGHVLGFTNIDDVGQEGLELAYNDWLKGVPGAKRIMREGKGGGGVIDVIERVKAARPGRDLRLSLDSRIQYLAYRELKAAVTANRAKSGSIVVLDPNTGEVLAMVNQPFFNPNNRASIKGDEYRNRAVTDLFEPGSTSKPFTIAAALESGEFTADSVVNTSPGKYYINGYPIKDRRDLGKIDLGTIISQSSNVGVSKVALEVPRETLWNTYRQAGFGQTTGSGFPGESHGVFRDYTRWYPLDQATLSFGYGFSVTALQLARAYSIFATDGVIHQVSFVANPEHASAAQAISPETACTVRNMLLRVVQPKGTGYRAAVEGYQVAGKTGTARKAVKGGYSKDHYVAVFAGMAPATAPELVVVVVINDPSAGEYYGGVVAAPVFSRVMAGALRQLNIAPDGLPARKKVADARADGGTV